MRALLLAGLTALLAGTLALPGSALTERGDSGESRHPFTAVELRSDTPRPRSVSALDTVQLTLSFLCIHQYEGAWTANTGNGYHGGLQMDSAFERAYGRAYLARWGHANRWPAAVQIAVAIRAFHSGRGFSPWPNTSRKCGLR